MCRLFLSINNENILPKLFSFLKQSDHDHKFTPGCNNYRDHIQHKDGFGFAWLVDNTYKIYKQPILYNQDKSLNDKLKEIKSSIVLGHIRNKSISDIKYDNTHPFIYENNVFIHNGFIKNFLKNKKLLMNYIDPKYKMLGETDSEFLFYLYLSIYNKIKDYKLSMKIMLNLFRYLKIELSANIIFANNEVVVITRYLVNDNKIEYPASLYYNNVSSNSLLITSEPITESWTIIPSNSIILFDIKNSIII
uniref:Glutamine amidotransferase type-2 domain-containing protein n=1 Tax=viral metagenome TaxID=1070528 RepID=A0A6C0DA88_9ZZZZ